MPEKKTIARISIITDDDTGMYSIGEVDGGFDRESLRQHIEDHGAGGIINHLAYMTAMTVEIAREIQAEKQPEAFSAANSSPCLKTERG